MVMHPGAKRIARAALDMVWRSVRSVVSQAIRLVLRFPAVSRPADALLQRLPRVRERLLVLAARNAVLNGPGSDGKGSREAVVTFINWAGPVSGESAQLAVPARRVRNDIRWRMRLIKESSVADRDSREANRESPAITCSGGTHARARLRLAFVSPLPPARTGIADYAAELLPALIAHYDLVLITEQSDHEIERRWKSLGAVRDPGWFESHASEFDRIVYQMGNSPRHLYMLGLLIRYPGVVVLHDFFLGHLMGADHDLIRSVLYESHGMAAMDHLSRHGLESAKRHFPGSWPVIRNALGTIVHSEHGRDLVADWFGTDAATDICVVPHPRNILRRGKRTISRTLLGLDEHLFIVGVFGAIGPGKCTINLLEAWNASRLGQDRQGLLVFVGENDPGHFGRRVASHVRRVGRRRIRVTGFVDADAYGHWLAAADMAVQLRSESRGETSGALLDCLGAGIATIYNAHGSAAELPENVGYRLPDQVDEKSLTSALDTLADCGNDRRRLSHNARNWVQAHCGPTQVAYDYHQAIEHLAVCSARRRQLDTVDTVVADMLQPETSADMTDLAAVSARIAGRGKTGTRQVLCDVTSAGDGPVPASLQDQLASLLALAPHNLRILPTRLEHLAGSWLLTSAASHCHGLPSVDDLIVAQGPLAVNQSDVVWVPDGARETVLRAAHAGLYADLKARGVTMHFGLDDWSVPDDRLPDSCTGAAWFNQVSKYASSILCPSASVVENIERWLASREARESCARPVIRVATTPDAVADAVLDLAHASDGGR